MSETLGSVSITKRWVSETKRKSTSMGRMGRTKPKVGSGQPIRLANLGFKAKARHPFFPIRFHPIHPIYPLRLQKENTDVSDRTDEVRWEGAIPGISDERPPPLRSSVSLSVAGGSNSWS